MVSRSFMRLGVAAAVLLLVACGSPKAGDTCSTTARSCDSEKVMLECIAGTMLAIACDGPAGCTPNGDAPGCDTSLATAGSTCPATVEGTAQCQASPPALLQCAAGVWRQQAACPAGCATTGGTPACNPEACGPSSCGGCCDGAGACIAAPQNQTPETCGAGGQRCGVCTGGNICGANFTCEPPSGGCGPFNCAGCCANGQCSPLSAATCGRDGRSCTNCGALGLVCNVATASCTVGATGGGAGGGAGGGTGSGGGTGGATSNPCGPVPTSGECISGTVVRFCAVPTGQGTPSVQFYSCPGGTACRSTGSGASCTNTGSCMMGDTECQGTGTLRTCNSSGQWVTSACANGCKASAVGSYCGAAGTTTARTGTLLFQRKNPNGSYSDWTALAPAPARNVFVVSMNGAGAWYDATVTGATGAYSVLVPASPAASDKVVFIAWGGNGRTVTYSLMDPVLGVGTYATGQAASGKRTWSWNQAVSSFASGATTTITQTQGSGALAIYDDLQRVVAADKNAHQGRGGLSVVVWFGIGTDWDCGACFSQYPAEGFDSQTWITGENIDQSFWGSAVNSHEFGHWAMASYGTSPAEGGTHTAGIPTFPGQAWSEGYATWHSAWIRNDPVYFDTQGGMFWIRLDTERYVDNSPLIAPTLAGGLLQKMDENKLSAILWRISTTGAGPLQQMHNALSSAHMNTSPWPRGYTRHTWNVDVNGNFSSVVDTGQRSLMLADYFDTLRCSGLGASVIDTAARTSSQYPYPSSTPICRPGYCYGCMSSTGVCQAGTSSSACGTAGVSCSVCGSSQACTQGVCL